MMHWSMHHAFIWVDLEKKKKKHLANMIGKKDNNRLNKRWSYTNNNDYDFIFFLNVIQKFWF